MKIIKKAARLITFTYKKEKYQLLPAGGAVKVPDEAKDESPFLASLISTRDIEIVSGAEVEAEPEEGSAIDQLREDAAELGVTVDNRWGESRLKEEIEKAQAE